MSEVPPEVREVVALLDAITPAAEQGPHAAGWSVAVDVAPDAALAVTEAPGGYLVTWSSRISARVARDVRGTAPGGSLRS